MSIAGFPSPLEVERPNQEPTTRGRPPAVGNAVRSTAFTRMSLERHVVHYSPKVLTKKVAICPRVLGLNGQYSSGDAWQPPVTPSA